MRLMTIVAGLLVLPAVEASAQVPETEDPWFAVEWFCDGVTDCTVVQAPNEQAAAEYVEDTELADCNFGGVSLPVAYSSELGAQHHCDEAKRGIRRVVSDCRWVVRSCVTLCDGKRRYFERSGCCRREAREAARHAACRYAQRHCTRVVRWRFAVMARPCRGR